MRRLLSMSNRTLLFLALFTPPLVTAQLAVTPIRQAGAPLDPSIHNEADHAIDLASDWLAAHQRADGSWGEQTGRVWRTSVALLALAANGASHSDAKARAAVWLDRNPPTAADPSDTPAWRLIALLSVASEGGPRPELTRRLLEDAKPLAPAPTAPLHSRLLWAEALRLAGRDPSPALGRPASDVAEVESLARQWAPATLPPHLLWCHARIINALANGALARGDGPLDWRRDLAQALINAQRRDPAGGAYWGPSGETDAVAETAFAVLGLSEL